ncbi:PEP-CTERM sorting domain-containing protein [Oxalobacteraceae bacterium]|nr:PEP-CTERM sorting domain-containing protein [Oxalobacteraceae bacterium]
MKNFCNSNGARICAAALLLSGAGAVHAAQLSGEHVDFIFDSGLFPGVSVVGDQLSFLPGDHIANNQLVSFKDVRIVAHAGYRLESIPTFNITGLLSAAGASSASVMAGFFAYRTDTNADLGFASYYDALSSPTGASVNAHFNSDGNVDSLEVYPGFQPDSMRVTLRWNLNADGIGSGVQLDSYSLHIQTVAIPEPASYGMMLAGLGLLGLLRRFSAHNRRHPL